MLKQIINYAPPIFFLVMGMITFAAYGIDKRKAIKGQWRIPEKTLLLLDLAGGFLGGWIGMYVFRHKTKHPKFYIVQFISTLIWTMVWGFLMEYAKI